MQWVKAELYKFFFQTYYVSVNIVLLVSICARHLNVIFLALFDTLFAVALNQSKAKAD